MLLQFTKKPGSSVRQTCMQSALSAAPPPPMAPLPQVQNSSEDCLYLNVYTPVPKKHAEAGRGAARKPALLPVMVYAASPIAVPTAR